MKTNRRGRIVLRLDLDRRLLLAALSLAALFAGGYALGETLTMTTYYPSPSGVYRRLISTGQALLARDGGSVGIGTTAPAYKLDVNGGARVSGLNVAGNASISGNLTTGGLAGIRTSSPGSYGGRQSSLDVAGYAAANDVWLKDHHRWAGQVRLTTQVVSKTAPCDGTTVVFCPAGTAILGGGNYTTEVGTCNGKNGDMWWTISRPFGNGWECGSDDYRAVCYAVCGSIF
jgi:hypothetical protein